ncbi:MAG: trypsin-like peptidase domain-containing protein [Lachnospiraceae bacterium]|nr:trypsin-like peptidase domain-containing protein [Lachnospiraceae bacterium]
MEYNYNGDNNNGENNFSQTNYDRSAFYKTDTDSENFTGSDNLGNNNGGIFSKGIKALLLAIVFICISLIAFAGTSTGISKLVAFSNSLATNEEDITSEDGSESEAESESEAATAESIKIDTVTDVSEVVENAMPSIVAITNIGTYEYQSFFGMTQSYESESAGSGIIMGQDDDNLYIATNNHVVSNADTLTVAFIDGTSVSAEVKGTDATTDLAVISVSKDSISDETKEQIRIAVFADSDDVSQGEFVIAIGNALGYGQSVTTGIVSALDREITVSDDTTGVTVTSELLQTDAAINPGNSGGALLNINGEVIGINSVKTSDTLVEGMGYAIPSTKALTILNELMTRELVDASKVGYLGVSGVDVSEEAANTYGMPQGVYVSKIVSGSAAELAGLQQGDIITGFAGRNITTMEEIQDILQYYEAGTAVDVVIQRSVNGAYEEMTLSVTLGKK